MDKELGELAGKLNSTYVAYGKDRWKAGNQELQTKNSAGQGAATGELRLASPAWRSDYLQKTGVDR